MQLSLVVLSLGPADAVENYKEKNLKAYHKKPKLAVTCPAVSDRWVSGVKMAVVTIPVLRVVVDWLI